MKADWAAVMISVIALAFSAATLYLQSFRKGRVVMARPRSVVLLEGELHERRGEQYVSRSLFRQCSRLQLSLSNTGPTHRTIEDLRLVARFDAQSKALTLGQWRRTIAPSDDESQLVEAGGDYAGALILPPTSAIDRVGVFMGNGSERFIRVGKCDCELQARLAGSNDWLTLSLFALDISQEAINAVTDGRWSSVPTLGTAPL